MIDTNISSYKQTVITLIFGLCFGLVCGKECFESFTLNVNTGSV